MDSCYIRKKNDHCDTKDLIVGKVKNISKKNFKYASIVFNLSDGSKNRIGSVAADIRSLKPGDIWSFQVSPALYQSMASYELEKVEGYEW